MAGISAFTFPVPKDVVKAACGTRPYWQYLDRAWDRRQLSLPNITYTKFTNTFPNVAIPHQRC
jgi:hypothetical protein